MASDFSRRALRGVFYATGRPHELQRGLLAIELVGPRAVVAWQSRLG